MTMGRGIPDKYMDSVIKLLVSEYGYVDDNSLSEVDVPEKKPEKVITVSYRWNNNYVPEYTDGIIRYREPGSGLWRRLWEYQSYLEKDKDGNKTGKRKIKGEFLPDTGEILKDKIGKYYVAKNGIKVYSFGGDLSKIG